MRKAPRLSTLVLLVHLFSCGGESTITEAQLPRGVDFQLIAGEEALLLSWKPAPGEINGYLVLRSTNEINFQPAKGTVYAAGSLIGDGLSQKQE